MQNRSDRRRGLGSGACISRRAPVRPRWGYIRNPRQARRTTATTTETGISSHARRGSKYRAPCERASKQAVFASLAVYCLLFVLSFFFLFVLYSSDLVSPGRFTTCVHSAFAGSRGDPSRLLPASTQAKEAPRRSRTLALPASRWRPCSGERRRKRERGASRGQTARE